jgi:hypothetical protein
MKTYIYLFIIYIITITYKYLLIYSHKKKVNNFTFEYKKPPFPIDVVYTWAGEKENTTIRQESFDELKYSLRSIKMFLPWVNNIYIFTNSPKTFPSWAKSDEELKKNNIIIVEHDEVFKNDHDITNSNLIETYIPFLPNLAEHYIYMNDDFFILRKLNYDDFFTSDGKAIVLKPRENTNMIKNGKETDLTFKLPQMSGFYKHIPISMIKSQVIDYQKEYSDYIQFVRNIKHRELLGCDICNKHNLKCPCQQQHYPPQIFMYDNGYAEYKTLILNDYLYFDMSVSSYFNFIYELITVKNTKYLCLNNAIKPVSKKYTINKFIKFAESYFFIKQDYEK